MVDEPPTCASLCCLFDAEKRPTDFAKIVDQPAGHFRCEREPVSIRSRMRPVRDEEVLARIIVGPKGLRDKNPLGLADTAISEMCRTGLSTLRVEEANIAEKIECLARYLVSRAADATPPRDEVFCAGVLEFTAGALRSFRIAGKPGARIIGAYESPEEKYPNHSDVLQAVNLFESATKSKNAAREFLSRGELTFYTAEEYKRANIKGLRLSGRMT